MRVVFDTNIYISAILFGGKPEKLLRLAKEGVFELLISGEIMAEIARVLRIKFGWESWRISMVIDEIRENTTLITPARRIQAVAEDEADNRVLECALEGGASYVISGDKHHLLPLKEFMGVKIVSASEFLEMISGGESGHP